MRKYSFYNCQLWWVLALQLRATVRQKYLRPATHYYFALLRASFVFFVSQGNTCAACGAW